ncbi:MAG: hypothetical protein EXS31_07870 [Pedosphaera sp.]|nr:hypothetical protein [Pedosphaera sp.]
MKTLSEHFDNLKVKTAYPENHELLRYFYILGAMQVAKRMMEIRDSVASGGTADGIKPLFDEINSEYSRLRSELKHQGQINFRN